MSKYYDLIDECKLISTLPICGCGRPEYSYEMFRKWLQYRKEVNDFTPDSDLFTSRLHEYKQFREENKLCQYFDKIFDDDNPNKELEGAYAIINGVLDELGCTEHGSSWYNSWLTEKGELMLAALNLAKEHDYEMGVDAEWCYQEINEK